MLGAISSILVTSVVGTVAMAPCLGPGNEAARALTTDKWPKSGSVHAFYNDDGRNPRWVGYDFQSGAWYLRDKHRVLGREVSGLEYSCDIDRDNYSILTKPDSGRSFHLDLYFPGFEVACVLGMASAVQGLTAMPDGAIRIETIQPRASRALSIEEIPVAEMSRWGGPEKIWRHVSYSLDSNGVILRIERDEFDAVRAKTPDRAECSLPGFHISNHPDPDDLEWRLVECRYEPSTNLMDFDGRELLRQGVEFASTRRVRTPVFRPSSDDPTASVITDKERYASWTWGNWMIVVGAILLSSAMLGLFLRRMRG